MKEIKDLILSEGYSIIEEDEVKLRAEDEESFIFVYRSRGGKNYVIRAKRKDWKGKGVFLQKIYSKENLIDIINQLKQGKIEKEKEIKKEKRKRRKREREDEKLILENNKDIYVLYNKGGSFDVPLVILKKEKDKCILIFYTKRILILNQA